MVAELFRLKARMLRNSLRGSPARVAGFVILLAVGIVGVVLLLVAAPQASLGDAPTVGRVIVLFGGEVTLSALLVPAMFSRMPLLHPRAFLGYRIGQSALTGMLVLVTLLGPALLLVPLALVPVLAWRAQPDPAGMPAAGLASLAAPLIVIELLLLLRIGVAAGGWLASRPALRGWVRVLGILLLLGGAGTVAVALLPRAPGRFWVPLAHAVQPLHIEGVADAISGSPLASLWGAPLQLVTRSGNPELAMLIGAEAIVLLAVIWRVIVAMTLRPSRRLRLDRVHRVPGVFRWLPATPAGAVTARSFLYWVRDPRYRVVFGILPVLPAITLLAFWVGGVPPSIGAFVPLGLMVLVLAWSTIHNDVAYDSTAIWTHVVAHTRGLHDRLGRVWPVLVFGTALIAVGTPISVWAQGELTSLPAMLGIDIALLLGGIGVGSAMSSRYPYPAPRPGDDGFTYPQASGSTGVGAQAGSFLLTVLVALLPITATALWLLGWSGFNWVALGTGVATGGLALALGVVSGGRVFDRRGPELLAFTMQN